MKKGKPLQKQDFVRMRDLKTERRTSDSHDMFGVKLTYTNTKLSMSEDIVGLLNSLKILVCNLFFQQFNCRCMLLNYTGLRGFHKYFDLFEKSGH